MQVEKFSGQALVASALAASLEVKKKRVFLMGSLTTENLATATSLLDTLVLPYATWQQAWITI